MAKPSTKPMVIPERGVIKGGVMNGWPYMFLGFQALPGCIRVNARISRPNWPFPRDVPLEFKHFATFKPVTGDRARRLEVDPLLKVAFQAAGLPVPDWEATKQKTLRLRTRRAAQPRKTR